MPPFRATLATLALLSLAACGDSDAEAADAGHSAPNDAGRADASRTDARTALETDAATTRDDAQVAACELPPDCVAVHSSVFNAEPCCDRDARCGLVYAGGALPAGDFYASFRLDVGSCIPESTLFFAAKSGDSARVSLADGGQILVSNGCETAFVTSLAFRGCCLPSNECALSTDAIHNELGLIAGDPSLPFAQVECVAPDELNAQLKASSLAGFAHLPDTTASCDYAALDTSLPKP